MPLYKENVPFSLYCTAHFPMYVWMYAVPHPPTPLMPIIPIVIIGDDDVVCPSTLTPQPFLLLLLLLLERGWSREDFANQFYRYRTPPLYHLIHLPRLGPLICPSSSWCPASIPQSPLLFLAGRRRDCCCSNPRPDYDFLNQFWGSTTHTYTRTREKQIHTVRNRLL